MRFTSKEKLLIFHRKYRTWIFLGWDLKKAIGIFEISTIEFFIM